MAMSIHACFAGIALGMQSQVMSFWGIYITIMAHKWAEAMTIGISFAKANATIKNSIIMIMLSALATPVGILLGYFFHF